jgi:hypothetical protein
MSRVHVAVERTGGAARFVPVSGLWRAADALTDSLPLDRESVYPRRLRRVGYWARLVLWDRALTNRDGTAVLVISRTPWILAGGAALAAGILVPKLPVAARRALVVLGAVFALQRRRLVRSVALERRLRRVARNSLTIGGLVAVDPGAAVPWIVEVLAALDRQESDIAFVALLPGTSRDRARERIYTRQFGFHVAERVDDGEKSVTILVRPGVGVPALTG